WFSYLHLSHRHTVTRFPRFYYNHSPTPEIYTLSLHDALPISQVILDNEFAPSPVSSSARVFGSWEIIRARVCQCARCRRDLRSKQPNETVPVPRKTAAECIQERNREFRTRFLVRLFVPAHEYCCHNRR